MSQRLFRSISIPPAAGVFTTTANDHQLITVPIVDRPSLNTVWRVTAIAFQQVVITPGAEEPITATLLLQGFPIAQAELIQTALLFAGVFQGGADLANEVAIYPLDLNMTLELMLTTTSATQVYSGQLLVSGTLDQAPTAF